MSDRDKPVMLAVSVSIKTGYDNTHASEKLVFSAEKDAHEVGARALLKLNERFGDVAKQNADLLAGSASLAKERMGELPADTKEEDYAPRVCIEAGTQRKDYSTMVTQVLVSAVRSERLKMPGGWCPPVEACHGLVRAALPAAVAAAIEAFGERLPEEAPADAPAE